jgi:magnesium chelatase family protein
LAKRRYLDRLSGPLLDRMDLVVPVEPVTVGAVVRGGEGEPSAVVAQRVAAAREAQRRRHAGLPWALNAHAEPRYLHGLPSTPELVRQVLVPWLETGELTMRGVDRVLRVAWTVADLAGRPEPTVADAELALALRLRGAQ